MDSASQLNAAFREIINTVSSEASAGGGAGLGANTTKISFTAGVSETTAFEAKFNADWSGTLEALPVQADGSLGAPYWEAGRLIPPGNLIAPGRLAQDLYPKQRRRPGVYQLHRQFGDSAESRCEWSRG